MVRCQEGGRHPVLIRSIEVFPCGFFQEVQIAIGCCFVIPARHFPSRGFPRAALSDTQTVQSRFRYRDSSLMITSGDVPVRRMETRRQSSSWQAASLERCVETRQRRRERFRLLEGSSARFHSWRIRLLKCRGDSFLFSVYLPNSSGKSSRGP